MNQSNPVAWVLVFACSLLAVSCGGSGGACVGESSPGNGLCKDGWSQEECEDWDADEVNGSSWTFHAGEGCEELGYTHTCEDGSYADNPCS